MNVSLIVVNFKNRKLLKEYLDSVAKQTLIPAEIFVVQYDPPDQETKALLKKYPRIKILLRYTDKGVGEGFNFAVKKALSPYLVYQSDDIRMDRNCLKKLVDKMEGDKKVGICTSICLEYMEKNEIKKAKIESAGALVDVYGFNWPYKIGKRLQDISESEEVFAMYGNSFIVRKSLYQKLGGYDEKYFALNDDIDFCWRVKLLGYKIVYCRDSFVYHRGHATLGTLYTSSRKRYWSERNSLRNLLKNYASPSLMRYFPGYCLLLGAEFMYHLVTLRFDLASALIRAVLWNIYNFHDTLKERKRIQSLRVISDDQIVKYMHPTSLKLRFHNLHKIISFI